MTSMQEVAAGFFEACETGKGWDRCAVYCHADATFSAQSGALADVKTVEQYAEWMKGLMVIAPDGTAEIRSFGVDEARHNVAIYGIFRGTHTGEGGPVPPTGRSVEADYVYVLGFEGEKVRHLTKIWNDSISLQQLGWA